MARELKADKVAAILSERRIRRNSPLAKFERGCVFLVVGSSTDPFAPQPYKVERYIGPDGDQVETCTCPAGVKRVPPCSHVEAARQVMDAMKEWTR